MDKDTGVDRYIKKKIDSISASQLSRRLKEMSSDFWGTAFTQHDNLMP